MKAILLKHLQQVGSGVDLRKHSSLDIQPAGVHEPDDGGHSFRGEVFGQVDHAVDLLREEQPSN